MSLSSFECALGGIGLFLFGMRIMSRGIRVVADDRIRNVLALLTSNRLYSFCCGMAMSLSFNSANSAIIVTVALLNSGVLTAFQALCVLGGVLVGSSLTLHFSGIPYILDATPFLCIGFFLKYFARNRRLANIGDLMLGVGLLFFGLTLLEGGTRFLITCYFNASINSVLFTSPIMAMLFGSIVFCFSPSSHSTITAILSVVSVQHPNINIASDMLLGSIVGFAFIGSLAAIGGTSAARRITLLFLLITVIVIVSLVVGFPYVFETVQNSTTSAGGMQSGYNRQNLCKNLVWLHMLASIMVANATLSFSGYFSRKLGVKIDSGGNGTVPQPCAGYLDMRVLSTPTLALEQARKEIIRMTAVASFMFADVLEILSYFDARRAATIRQHEEVLDSLNHEITAFLAALARTNTSSDISYNIPGLLQMVTDIEHIGDSCENILDAIISRKESDIIFSDAAMSDLLKLATVVDAMFKDVEAVISKGIFISRDDFRGIKNDVRIIIDQIKLSHFDRICTGVCPPRSAMLFNELTDAFVRIAELCWNIIALQGRKIL